MKLFWPLEHRDMGMKGLDWKSLGPETADRRRPVPKLAELRERMYRGNSEGLGNLDLGAKVTDAFVGLEVFPRHRGRAPRGLLVLSAQCWLHRVAQTSSYVYERRVSAVSLGPDGPLKVKAAIL